MYGQRRDGPGLALCFMLHQSCLVDQAWSMMPHDMNVTRARQHAGGVQLAELTLSPTSEASSERALMSRISAPPAKSWEILSWYACTVCLSVACGAELQLLVP